MKPSSSMMNCRFFFRPIFHWFYFGVLLSNLYRYRLILTSILILLVLNLQFANFEFCIFYFVFWILNSKFSTNTFCWLSLHINMHTNCFVFLLCLVLASINLNCPNASEFETAMTYLYGAELWWAMLFMRICSAHWWLLWNSTYFKQSNGIRATNTCKVRWKWSLSEWVANNYRSYARMYVSISANDITKWRDGHSNSPLLVLRLHTHIWPHYLTVVSYEVNTEQLTSVQLSTTGRFESIHRKSEKYERT